MDYLQVLIQAVVQGITEFLPISSDGHLVLAGAIFAALTGQPLEGHQLTLTIVLHAGTLVTVIVMFWRHLVRLLTVDRRVIPLLIVGTIPVGVFGLALEKWCEPLLESPLAAGVGLVITGLALVWSKGRDPDDAHGRSYTELTYREALLIGVFQAIAALPGVSRSGLTIVSGLGLCRLKRSEAANFSFLLSVPAIGGVVTVKLLQLLLKGESTGFPVPSLVLGAVVSCLVGFAALAWLLVWLRGGRLHLFAWWCIPLGLIVIAWQLLVS